MPEYTVAIDRNTGRPACVLLQAVYGLGIDCTALTAIGSEHWLTSPADTDFRLVTGTLDQWSDYGRRLSTR